MKTKILFMALFAFLSVKMQAQILCNANFTATVSPNGSATFTGTATNTVSTVYYWSFGNGTSTYGMSSSATATYNASGNYVVCLTVVDTFNNCTDSSCQTITVSTGTPSCTASYTYSASSNTSVNLVSTGTSTSTMQYSWIMNGNVIGTGSTFNYTNTVAGNYPICLVIYDPTTSCTDSVCQTVTIGGGTTSCTASFYIYPDTLGAPHTYIGVNNSTNGASAYTWSWGDGSSSTGQYPSHTYATAGNYTICLTVGAPNTACYDTMCISASINKTAAMYSINFANPTAVGSVSKDLATIYPNPANESFIIKGLSSNKYQVEFLTINGSKVKTVSANGNQSINISSLANNIYILKITDQNGATQYSKLIKD